MKTLFLEDLAIGQHYGSPALPLSPEPDCNEFMPGSPMHVASLTMRMIIQGEFRPHGGMLGAEVRELRWPQPARIGELLHVDSEILELRRSNSRPERGIARIRNTTLNAADEAVQVMTATVFLAARSMPS